MAGALTANSVERQYAEDPVSPAEVATIATVALLSPVEGANNVLLTAIVEVTEGSDADEVTFQWHRAGIGEIAETAVLGDAVGDPFVVTTDNDEVSNLVTVQAIDRGAGMTSGYALTVVNDPGELAQSLALYADAVLYD
jgi:hypothetical protein